jgi:secondary thiamine-phosphate synthase enzyme
MWIQRRLQLKPMRRGFHLVTSQIVDALPELSKVKIGLVHGLLMHTSASLSINENADPDVRHDLEMAISKIAPESFPYIHTLEGADDMPAHVKSALIGVSVTLPVSGGRLALGTWQGVYLGEHRDHADGRTILLTLQGES